MKASRTSGLMGFLRDKEIGPTPEHENNVGPECTTRRSSRRSYWCITAIVAVVLAIIVAVVVGVAVSLTNKKKSRNLDTTILLPLYIYPDPGAWDPVYRAVSANPDLEFIVVVNPHSGPGDDAFPSAEYTGAIQNLTSHPNVRPVGYVRTGYGSRNIDDVLRDISVYSGWETTEKTGLNSTAMAMHGIFFDEAPHTYAADTADYMTRINQAVKDASGIISPKTVIHNPGTPPDEGLTDANTDITIVFEQSYDLFQEQQAELMALHGARSSKAFVIHSVPSSVGLRKFVDQLSMQAGNLFLTDLTSKYYNSFGRDWSAFVDSMR